MARSATTTSLDQCSASERRYIRSKWRRSLGLFGPKKRQNRGLQRGFSLSGTLQEGLFTGSRVLNEVVLAGLWRFTLRSKLRQLGVSPTPVSLLPCRSPRVTRNKSSMLTIPCVAALKRRRSFDGSSRARPLVARRSRSVSLAGEQTA